jgi:hypothetical protein
MRRPWDVWHYGQLMSESFLEWSAKCESNFYEGPHARNSMDRDEWIKNRDGYHFVTKS